MRVGPALNSRTLNLGTFQFKLIQGRHLSKADKNFCPVSARFRDVPLYSKMHLVSHTNTHPDVTDLVNHGMVKNTKT